MARLQLISILMGATLAACEQSPPPYLTRTESKSPDGKWIADAVTTQESGAGQFGFHTTVYLMPSTDPKALASILVFPNEISKEKGKIDVHFRWFDGTLEVLLSRLPVFETKVTQYAGMNITVSHSLKNRFPSQPSNWKTSFIPPTSKTPAVSLQTFTATPKP